MPPEDRNPKRRRPRGKKKRAKPDQPNPAAPLRALSRNKPAASDKSADEPLTPSEVQQMKGHFKFLRAHRKVLKLRLNAAEDLLLNGVREPTHRGVCQHLLGKVEKDRVLVVSERLPAPEAAKLLAGVLGFAPEVSYVLRYLECVEGSASKKESAAALSQALRQIRFDETSNAQMRQVLSLIVSVFPRGELPVLVFNWLYNGAFREAIDRSSEDLPRELAELVHPIRAVHRAMAPRGGRVRQRRSAHVPQEIAEGVRLLLGSLRPSLRALPEGVRMQLLELGVHTPVLTGAELVGLCTLFEAATFPRPEEQGRVALGVAARLLAAGDETKAREWLGQDRFPGPTTAIARRWKRTLDDPRIGPVAVEERAPRHHSKKGSPHEQDREPPPPHRWLPGFHIAEQVRVRLRYGGSENRDEYRRQLQLWQSVLLPNVARPVAMDSEGETPYVAVARLEKSLRRVLQDGGDEHRLGVEVCEVLNAVALAGVCLPDGDVDRFSVDEPGRVWLVDLWGATRAEPEFASEQHAKFARDLLSEFSTELAEHPPKTLLELARRLKG